MARCLSLFVRTIFAHQRRRARKLGVNQPLCGAVTFIHRFDSLLRLNVHFHTFVPFGRDDAGELTVVELPPPTDADVQALLQRTAQRIEHLLQDTEACADGDDDPSALDQAIADAARPPSRLVRWVSQPVAALDKPRCSHLEGYCVHANVSCDPDDREGLERMLRYGARPPLCQDRVSLRDGMVVYTLGKPYDDGRTEVVFTPEAFIRRLAALIPPPWLNLMRCHGVFSSAARQRKAALSLVPPLAPADPAGADQADHPDADTVTHDGPFRSAWAELLRRTMDIDVTCCPDCGSRMRLLAVIKDKSVIDKILTHLGLPTDPSPAEPARPPPQTVLQPICDSPGHHQLRHEEGLAASHSDHSQARQAPPAARSAEVTARARGRR